MMTIRDFLEAIERIRILHPGVDDYLLVIDMPDPQDTLDYTVELGPRQTIVVKEIQ